MPTATLVPNGTHAGTTKGTWTPVGAGTVVACVSDSNDATYITNPVVDNGWDNPVIRFEMNSFTVPANNFIKAIRVHVRASRHASAPAMTAGADWSDDYNPYFASYWYKSAEIAPAAGSSSIATYSSGDGRPVDAIRTWQLDTGAALGKTPQQVVDNIKVWLQFGTKITTAAAWRIYRVWAEVDYEPLPAVTVALDPPDANLQTLRPNIKWTVARTAKMAPEAAWVVVWKKSQIDAYPGGRAAFEAAKRESGYIFSRFLVPQPMVGSYVKPDGSTEYAVKGRLGGSSYGGDDYAERKFNASNPDAWTPQTPLENNVDYVAYVTPVSTVNGYDADMSAGATIASGIGSKPVRFEFRLQVPTPPAPSPGTAVLIPEPKLFQATVEVDVPPDAPADGLRLILQRRVVGGHEASWVNVINAGSAAPGTTARHHDSMAPAGGEYEYRAAFQLVTMGNTSQSDWVPVPGAYRAPQATVLKDATIRSTDKFAYTVRLPLMGDLEWVEEQYGGEFRPLGGRNPIVVTDANGGRRTRLEARFEGEGAWATFNLLRTSGLPLLLQEATGYQAWVRIVGAGRVRQLRTQGRLGAATRVYDFSGEVVEVDPPIGATTQGAAS